MQRNICFVSRSILRIKCNNSKNALFSIVRTKSDVANILKAGRYKKEKESFELFKYFLLAIPVTSFGLGCWQAYRLNWKLELIEQMEAKSNADPKVMPSDFEELKKIEYMPVKVKGVFLHEKEFLIGPRALIEHTPSAQFGSLVSDPSKNQGWLVVTPFKLSDTGEVILINRGWVHQNNKSNEKRLPSLITREVELVGVVRLTETRPPFMPKNMPQKRTWFYRDLDQMSSYLGCAPVWLDARGDPEPPEGWPIPNQTRVTLRNEHMSYLVTWFSLSAFTGYMWHRYFIKKLPLL